MRSSDVGSSISLGAAGIFMAWQSLKLEVGSFRVPMPGFFPLCLSLILIGFALLIFVQGLRQEAPEPPPRRKRERVAIALAAVFAFAYLMEPAGYLLSAFLLCWVLLKLMVRQVWWYAPSVAAAMSGASFVIFKVLLKVSLPAGPLGF